jgi:beta-barrel assembly-enhancing protease
MFALLAFATLAVDPSLTRLQAEDARVAAISWRLQTANVALCPQKTAISGLSLHALSQYQSAQRAAASAQFGLADHVGIAAVARGSAADRAGIRVGNMLLAVDGEPTPPVAADAGYAPVARSETMLESALAKSPMTVTVQSSTGSEARIVLSGDVACASRIQIVAGSAINAQADGRYVQINAKMLEFVASDDELATIMGHELAHNILRHIALKTPSKQAEYAADRLGVWLMARAGYDVEAVLPFWTRFEKRTNAGIFADGTHPSSKKRLAAVAAAVAAFKAQRATGQPLVPPAQ